MYSLDVIGPRSSSSGGSTRSVTSACRRRWLSRSSDRVKPAGDPFSNARLLPSPLHLLAGVLDWDAIPWRDRLAVLKLSGPLRRARRELLRTGTVSAEPRGTVSDWLAAHGQRDKLRTWLWEPLAVAALNQSPAVAAAAPFVRVLAEMFGPDAADSALVLPTRPLHQMYAEPARAFIEAHGGEVRVNALARVVVEQGHVRAIDIRGERIHTRHIIAAVPWFDLGRLFLPAPPSQLAAILAAANAMTPMPIVTVNLWYDRRVMDDPFVGLPGREMQWVFDKRIAFGSDASHLSLVSSGATRLTAMGRDELTALAAREVEDALPAARRPPHSGNRHPRKTGHVFAGARATLAARHTDTGRGALSRGRLDRHGAARHHRKRCGQRPQAVTIV